MNRYRINRPMFIGGFISFFLLVGVFSVSAQEGIHSSGGDAVGSGGSVSYSVGQVFYQTHVGSGISIAEGVQQPYEISSSRILDASADTLLLSSPILCEGTKKVSLVVSNRGNVVIDHLTIEWEVGGVPRPPVFYAGALYPEGSPSGSSSDVVELGSVSFDLGTPVSIRAVVTDPNSDIDQKADNDMFLKTYEASAPLPSASGIVVVEGLGGNFTLKIDNPQHVATYHWDFGDGTTDEFNDNFNISKHYPIAGQYVITVVLENSCGEKTLTSLPFQSLPVEMGLLSGRLTDKGFAELSWDTYSETNNKGFRVYRSYDGREFSPVGFVPSAAEDGVSREKLAYRYLDPEPVTAATFYQIVQEDFDGGSAYSNIVRLHSPAVSDFAMRAFPNPAAGSVRIRFHVLPPPGSVLRLIDIHGRVVRSIEPRDLETDLSLHGLASGAYLLHYDDGTASHQLKLIKE